MSHGARVVSYRNSTSNHNIGEPPEGPEAVVSYRNSTSNHNNVFGTVSVIPLYLIEILHQTTTAEIAWLFVCGCILSKFYIKPQLFVTASYAGVCCILSKFYIKPQLVAGSMSNVASCILSKFYIKPQRADIHSRSGIVVSYRNSTSNHNFDNRLSVCRLVVSYRNSTSNHNCRRSTRPGHAVVSYRNSTSNHNSRCRRDPFRHQ